MKIYKLTIIQAWDGRTVDSTKVFCPIELTKKERLKRVNQRVSYMGYRGKDYKTSLKLLTAEELCQIQK